MAEAEMVSLISDIHTGSVTEAQAIVRRLMEHAALICEEQQAVFLSPEYATGQPLSSFGERFACGQCAKIIREAAGLPDPHGGRDGR